MILPFDLRKSYHYARTVTLKFHASTLQAYTQLLVALLGASAYTYRQSWVHDAILPTLSQTIVGIVIGIISTYAQLVLLFI